MLGKTNLLCSSVFEKKAVSFQSPNRVQSDHINSWTTLSVDNAVREDLHIKYSTSPKADLTPDDFRLGFKIEGQKKIG